MKSTCLLSRELIIVVCGLRADFSRSGSLPLLYSDYLYLANRVGRRLQSQYRVNGLVVSGDKGGKTSIDAALLSTLLASASRRVIQTYQHKANLSRLIYDLIHGNSRKIGRHDV